MITIILLLGSGMGLYWLLKEPSDSAYSNVVRQSSRQEEHNQPSTVIVSAKGLTANKQLTTNNYFNESLKEVP